MNKYLMSALVVACGMISGMQLAFIVVELVIIIQGYSFNEDLLSMCIINLPLIIFFFWAATDSEVRERIKDIIHD